MRNQTTKPEPRSRADAAAVRFVVTALGLGLLLVGLFRVPWIQRQLLIPYALGQQRVAGWFLGLDELPVVVNFSCTGADVMALCIAAIAAFPAPALRRLSGIAVGLLLISAVNTVRIGSLSLAVHDRPRFDLLHLYLWPAVLIVVVALYVFAWMRAVRAGERPGGGEPAPPAARLGEPAFVRFAVWLVLLVVAYVIGSSWYLESGWLLAMARGAAAAGAALMSLFGLDARVIDNVLTTEHGSFVVTATCIATPLIPVYFAAVGAFRMSLLRRLALIAAGPLLFFVLGTARLLVLALPANLVPSHAVAIHAFNQLVFALLLVALAALWQGRTAGEERGEWARQAVAAVAIGLGAGLVGVLWTRLLTAAAGALQSIAGHGGHLPLDSQGATSLLPAFQLALCAALWRALSLPVRGGGAGRLALAVLGLGGTQLLLLVGLGELWAHREWEPHVRDLRAWAVLLPVVIVPALGGRLRWPRRSGADTV